MNFALKDNIKENQHFVLALVSSVILLGPFMVQLANVALGR